MPCFSLPDSIQRLNCIRRRSRSKSSKLSKSNSSKTSNSSQTDLSKSSDSSKSMYKSTEYAHLWTKLIPDMTETVAMKPSWVAWHTWDLIMSAYPILHRNLREMPLRCDQKQFFLVTQMIVDKKLSFTVSSAVIDTALYDIHSEMSMLWSDFAYKKLNVNVKNVLPYHINAQDLNGFIKFSDTMNKLFVIAESKMYFVGRLQCIHEDTMMNMPVLNYFTLQLVTSIYPKFPKDYRKNIAHFLRTGLRSIDKDQPKPISFIENKHRCENCFMEEDKCGCDELVHRFIRTNWQLNQLNLTEFVLRDILVDVMSKQIQSKLKTFDANNLEESQLPLLKNWLNTTVYDWMKQICEPVYDSTSKVTKSELCYVMNKLDIFLNKSFAMTKLRKLHELAYHFPGAMPAVKDLTTAYTNSQMCDGDLELVSMNLMMGKPSVPENVLSSMLSDNMKYKNVLDIVDPSGALFEYFNKVLEKYSRHKIIMKPFQYMMFGSV